MTVEEAVKKAKSYGEVMVLLGYKSRGGNTYQKLRKEILELGCDTSHFESPTYEENNIFVENSTYRNMARLKKKRLQNANCCLMRVNAVATLGNGMVRG